MLPYTTLQYTTIHFTNWTTPHHNYNCNCNYTTLATLHRNYNLQLQLHYTTTTTTPTTTTTAALHHTTSSSCGGVSDRCNHSNHSRKHNSNHLSVHQWIRSAICESQQPTLPIGFLFLKLPPPPCAVLLVVIVGLTKFANLWSWSSNLGEFFESASVRSTIPAGKSRTRSPIFC